MPKKSFIKILLERRIPHIMASYLVAGTSLILFVEYLVDKYQFPSYYPTLALFALIGILPSVIILSYFHGAPGKDEWTNIEKVGIPINVLFIAGALFFGDSLNIWEMENNISDKKNKGSLLVDLKYTNGSPVITEIRRVSKPGRRIYTRADSIPKIKSGLGIAIMSTSMGIMSDNDARSKNVGGEIICRVF